MFVTEERRDRLDKSVPSTHLHNRSKFPTLKLSLHSILLASLPIPQRPPQGRRLRQSPKANSKSREEYSDGLGARDAPGVQRDIGPSLEQVLLKTEGTWVRGGNDVGFWGVWPETEKDFTKT
jgi:hypothetical protein